MAKTPEEKNASHKKSMAKQKTKVDARIEEASTERGILLLLTGNGKGKSSSGFGMVMRALGYQQKVGVVQFIKGVQLSGEEIFIRDKHPEVDFYQMGTGFTWDTQDRTSDIEAAERTWKEAARMLADETISLVLLDEMTYMLAYKYLDEDMILSALEQRPYEQSVIVTGRGGGSKLIELADTVSEMQEIKHCFKEGVKARIGADF